VGSGPLIPLRVSFPMHPGCNLRGHIPRVRVTPTAITSEHIRHAFLDGTKLAIPDHIAGADRHDRAPGGVPVGLASRNIEAQGHG
jgi:hypothetical protein